MTVLSITKCNSCGKKAEGPQEDGWIHLTRDRAIGLFAVDFWTAREDFCSDRCLAKDLAKRMNPKKG